MDNLSYSNVSSTLDKNYETYKKLNSHLLKEPASCPNRELICKAALDHLSDMKIPYVKLRRLKESDLSQYTTPPPSSKASTPRSRCGRRLLPCKYREFDASPITKKNCQTTRRSLNLSVDSDCDKKTNSSSKKHKKFNKHPNETKRQRLSSAGQNTRNDLVDTPSTLGGKSVNEIAIQTSPICNQSVAVQTDFKRSPPPLSKKFICPSPTSIEVERQEEYSEKRKIDVVINAPNFIGPDHYKFFFDLNKYINVINTEDSTHNGPICVSSENSPQKYILDNKNSLNMIETGKKRSRKRKLASDFDDKIMPPKKTKRSRKPKGDLAKFIEKFADECVQTDMETVNANSSPGDSGYSTFNDKISTVTLDEDARAVASILSKPPSERSQIEDGIDESIDNDTRQILYTNDQTGEWIRTIVMDGYYNRTSTAAESSLSSSKQVNTSNDETFLQNSKFINSSEQFNDDLIVLPNDIEQDAMGLVEFIENPNCVEILRNIQYSTTTSVDMPTTNPISNDVMLSSATIKNPKVTEIVSRMRARRYSDPVNKNELKNNTSLSEIKEILTNDNFKTPLSENSNKTTSRRMTFCESNGNELLKSDKLNKLTEIDKQNKFRDMPSLDDIPEPLTESSKQMENVQEKENNNQLEDAADLMENASENGNKTIDNIQKIKDPEETILEMESRNLSDNFNEDGEKTNDDYDIDKLLDTSKKDSQREEDDDDVLSLFAPSILGSPGMDYLEEHNEKLSTNLLLSELNLDLDQRSLTDSPIFESNEMPPPLISTINDDMEIKYSHFLNSHSNDSQTKTTSEDNFNGTMATTTNINNMSFEYVSPMNGLYETRATEMSSLSLASKNSTVKRNISNISQLFGHICFAFKVGSGSCKYQPCKFSHKLIEKNVLKNNLMNLTDETLDFAYKFTWNSRLFLEYFSVFCELYGDKKNYAKLEDMTSKIGMYNNGEIYLENIRDAFIKCGDTKSEALRRIYFHISKEPIKIRNKLVEMMINCDAIKFIDVLEKFSKEKDYKFEFNSIIKLSRVCNETKHSDLSRLVIMQLTKSENELKNNSNKDIEHFLKFIAQSNK